MFYSHTGTFEDNNLILTCEDFLPMDLGTSGWTEFRMNEDVAAYIADNIELFDCEIGILHSHHSLGAFLSGQDIQRINEDGNDTNCFLSLVVDTKGAYVAAITRKVKRKQRVVTTDLGSSYEFFGEGTKQLSAPETNTTTIVKDEVIEYYMLDVERETVNNPLEYLDTRFEEIEKKKAEARKTQTISSYPTSTIPWKDYEDNRSFDAWRNDKYSEPKVKEQYLFDEDTMKEMEATPTLEISEEKIHKCICQMLTCSMLINVEKFNIDNWIKYHMNALYESLFINVDSFDTWAEFIVDYLIINFFDKSLNEEAYDQIDAFQSLVAQSMYEELAAYKDANSYINEYLKVIDRYIV